MMNGEEKAAEPFLLEPVCNWLRDVLDFFLLEPVCNWLRDVSDFL